MDIERLAIQNPWWNNGNLIKEDDKVKNVLSSDKKIQFPLKPENEVLVGPRQLGKTTALKYDIYQKIVEQKIDPTRVMYYSFDTSRKFEDISEVINIFTSRTDGKLFLYLDEISFVEEWQRAIKSFLDSKDSSRATLYITGSSSINLKKELMPGRNIKFLEFLSLSFKEFIISFGSNKLKTALQRISVDDLDHAAAHAGKLIHHFKEIESLFKVYIETGGYPDAILDYMRNGKISTAVHEVHWNAFVSDISKSGKSVEIATAIIYGLVQSYSTKVNLSGIARMQGIKSHVTVREYIETFEDLFASKSIFPVSGRRYVFRKERKVYFSDPFLYNMFAQKLNLVDKEKESKIVEGILFNHIYRFINRSKSLSEPKLAVGFHSGKKEIDFVKGDVGMELKWQNEVNLSDFPKSDIKKKVLLSKRTIKSEDGIVIIPVQLFLSVM